LALLTQNLILFRQKINTVHLKFSKKIRFDYFWYFSPVEFLNTGWDSKISAIFSTKSVQRWRRQLLLLNSTSFCTVRQPNLCTQHLFHIFFAARNFLCIKTVCSHHTLNSYSKGIFYVLFNTYFFSFSISIL
jgi:hypothetical protein